MIDTVVFGDRYELREKIGSGGMADVYKAYDQRVGRDVAIKVIKDEIATDEDNIRRFREEAKIIMSLGHPSILPIHDVELDEHPLYIVMRYLKGGTLLHVINKAVVVPLPEILNMMSKIAPGIDVVHENGIIHRDVTPNNIMLDIHGNVYITDFGVARIVGGPSQTQEGAIIGTVKYMAPEQISSGATIDKRADLYGLGVIIFEMATGAPPFNGNVVEIIQAKLYGEIPSANALNPDLPDGFDAFIQRALARSPEERFDSAQEMVSVLRAFVSTDDEHDLAMETVKTIIADVFKELDENPLNRTPTTKPQPSAGGQRRSIQQFLPVAMLLLGLIGGFGFGWQSDFAGTAGAPMDILAEVQARGYLNCGVNGQVPNFSQTPADSTETRVDTDATGFDTDYCRVVATAVFGSFEGNVNYVDLTSSRRLPAVEDRVVDVLFRNTTWTAGREQTYDIAFGPVIYYDTQGFIFHNDRGVRQLEDMAGLTICVQTATTTHRNLINLRTSSGVVFDIITRNQGAGFENEVDVFGNYLLDECDAVTADLSQIIGFAARPGFVPEEHTILSEGDFSLSKEPLAPVYHSQDSRWGSIVNYAVYATIAAAEMGVTRNNVSDMAANPNLDPQTAILLGSIQPSENQIQIGESLGIADNFAENIIANVGNYDEIYERNLAQVLGTERGINQLYTDGGIMYAIPFTLVDRR